MNNDLISRDALLFETRQQLAFQKEKAKLTTIDADKMSYSLVATGLQLAIDIINNAPTVEPENTRPHGNWNYIQSRMCVCPFCGAMPHKLYKNFCAKCGADMRQEESE